MELSQADVEASGDLGDQDGSQSGEEFQLNQFVRYREESPSNVYLKGKAEDYDQFFLVAFQLIPQEDRISVEHLVCLAVDDKQSIRKIDLDSEKDHEDISLSIGKVLHELSGSQLKDSKQLQNKLKSVIVREEILENLWGSVKSESLEELREYIRELLRSEVYPGTHLNLSVQVRPEYGPDQKDQEDPPEESKPSDQSIESESRGAEDDSHDQETSDATVLAVQPVYDPMDGVALSRLETGDELDVRVVEPSLEKIDPSLIKEDSPEEAEESIPISSTLLSEDESPRDSLRNYRVRLEPGIEGEFSVDPSTRVRVQDYDDLPPSVRIRDRVRNIVVISLIFLFSASMVAFFFPQPLITLLEKVLFGF